VNPLQWLSGWSTPYIAAAAFAGGLALAGPAAWYVGRLPLQAELAEQHEAAARQQLRMAERAAEVLQTAADRGDALSTALAQSQAQIDQLSRRRRDAITKNTTGRACLDGPALRLLNGAPGLSVSGLPEAASGAAAADGAAAANTDKPDSGAASITSTDADITGWALDAGAQYATCRARLDTLIDWFSK